MARLSGLIADCVRYGSIINCWAGGLGNRRFCGSEMNHSVLVDDEIAPVVSVERHVDGLLDDIEPLGDVVFDHWDWQWVRRLFK